MFDASYMILEGTATTFGRVIKAQYHSHAEYLASEEWLKPSTDKGIHDISRKFRATKRHIDVAGSMLTFNSDFPLHPFTGGESKSHLDYTYDSISKLLASPGGWSLFMYDHEEQRLLIGRDVFGRYPLLYAVQWIDKRRRVLHIAHAARDDCLVWRDLPHGQVTVIDLPVFGATVYTGVGDDYWERLWRRSFPISAVRRVRSTRPALVISKRNLRPWILGPLTPTGLLIRKLSLVIAHCVPIEAKSVAVCFSGGVDSVLLTRILLMVRPNTQVDLINVAFLRDDSKEEVWEGDRQRAIVGFDWLQQLAPERGRLRLLTVDVKEEELERARRYLIPLACRPSTSVMDENIAAVLFFAFRGKGFNYHAAKAVPVRTQSDIRLVGSGADELFAGYSRHRSEYTASGDHATVAKECEKELARLGLRNGGRDSRMAALFGVRLRAPFLFGPFVEFVNRLPVLDKADLSLPAGVGDKRIIREALAMLGGSKEICETVKAAMQFGSGLGKMEKNCGRSFKGTDMSPFLVHSLLQEHVQ